MNSWNRLFIVVLVLSAFAIFPQTGFAQVPKRGDDDPDMPALLAKYRDWGLPLPPAQAKLVLCRSGSGWIDGELHELFNIGFRVLGKDDVPASILVGTEWIPEKKNWNLIDVADIEPQRVRANQRKIFSYNSASATAVQFEAIGAHAMAVALFKAGAKSYPHLAASKPGSLDGVTSQPSDLSPKAVLAYIAWAHWVIALQEPNSDRAAIARRLEDLAAAEPGLAKDEQKTALLRSVKLTLRPTQSAPQSIEAMIDDLTEVSGTAGLTTFSLGALRNDPRYLKLAMRGFEAVPALIQHLSDRRVTRVIRGTGNMAVPLQLCVGDLVSRILHDVAGDGLSPNWLADRERLTPEHQASAVDWWASAKLEREEDYMVAHVYPPRQGRFQHVYELMLRIIAARYPAHLQSLYSKMAELPFATVPPNVGLADVSGELLANIVVNSELPRDEKIGVLLRASGHPDSPLADASWTALKQFPSDDVERVKATLKNKQ